jgi:hypothetical protein
VQQPGESLRGILEMEQNERLPFAAHDAQGHVDWAKVLFLRSAVHGLPRGAFTARGIFSTLIAAVLCRSTHFAEVMSRGQ